MSEPKEDWCPTMAGSTTAYEAEMRGSHWFEGEELWSKWERVPTEDGPFRPGSIPYPLSSGGVFQTVGLHGHAQAQAVAWLAKAHAEAVGKRIEVRVVPYELKYDIKARKRSDDTPRHSQEEK